MFSTNYVWNIFHFKKNWVRYDHKYVSVKMLSTRYSFQMLMQLVFSRQIFKKYSNIKFRGNPCSGAELFHANGQTDIQTWRRWLSLFAILRTRLAQCGRKSSPNKQMIEDVRWIEMAKKAVRLRTVWHERLWLRETENFVVQWMVIN
jgi:hypothetical protein